MTSKRISKVFKIWEFPKNARRRWFSLLKDEIWFYDERSSYGVPLDECEIADNWRYDFEHLAWLRLYMRRRILRTPWFMLRLHTFFSGDDDSAPHDHPFRFITIPFRSYEEIVEKEVIYEGGIIWERFKELVRAFWPSYRPAEYRHYVLTPPRPFTTLVLSTTERRMWGFWPVSDQFVPFNEWTEYE